MATVVNDRDVLIMATTPRYTVATDRGMFVTPSTGIFVLDSDGQASAPGSFTFRATQLNLPGMATWSWSDGMEPVVNSDNSVTLDYENFSAVSGELTASITVDGQNYAAIATVSKVASGSVGLDGARGNVDIAAATAGHVWTDTEAAAALAASGYGAPQNRDLVRLYNADRTFSVQKEYNGAQWVTVDYVYDGSVFVKGSILPEAIDTRGLTIRDNTGAIILGAGTALPASYAAPGTLNNDLVPSINYAATAATWAGVVGSGKPQDNATAGATIGQNLFGQMNAEDISTYIAAAAIHLALIDTASIGSLSALSAVVGLLRTATWGGRMEIENNQQRIYDDSNNLVVEIGRLD